MSKLDDIKATDQNKNLMMYIIHKLETDKNADLIDYKSTFFIIINLVHEKIDYDFMTKYPLS